MPLDKSGVLGLLEAVDAELTRKITLVAAGGTAMTLLDLKPSTIDIDFTGPHKDIAEFNNVQRSIPHGFEVQTWTNGMVFSQQLPDDYSRVVHHHKRCNNSIISLYIFKFPTSAQWYA